MSLTEHGISTTTERNTFRYETFRLIGMKGTRIQWDYRDAGGQLHSGIARDLEAAKAAARNFGYKEV